MNDSWWYILPPYRQEDFHWSKKALPGTYKWATGKGSAYATIQVLGGNPPEDVDVDMGIALVHIKAKGKDVEIDFTQDAADTYKGKPYHIKPPSMGKRKNPITAITTSVKELTEAFKNEGSQGDIGFSLKEAQDYYKRGDKPIESTITQELKRDDDLTLYGARAVNAQLPKYLQSHTDDFDIYTSESSVIQAKRLEKILDKKYGGNYFRVEPAQYKGTFHIKSNITNRTIADMTVTKDDIPHKEVDGMNVATLDFQVDKIRESLSNPQSKFRRGKDLEALQRILIGRTLAKEKKKIEAPVSLAIKREKKAEEKPSFPILPSRYYLGRKLRDANLGDIV